MNKIENTKTARRKIRPVALAVLVLSIVGVGILLADYYRPVLEDGSRTFVGRQSCIECHQEQADLFHGSHHDLAMDLASPETVLASFDGVKIEHYGLTSTAFRDGEKFMINTEGPDGQMSDFEVKYVFGVQPLQQYMVELDRPKDAEPGEIGRVQVLRLSWDTEQKKWFYLSPPDVDEKIEPNDPLHWTGITQCWNTSCAECHSTDLKKNFSVVSNQYRTTFSEIDVSCEACHGPGSQHVELANRKSIFWDREHGFGLVNLKTTSNIPQIESCAPCHSRRSPIATDFAAGCNFDDYYALQLVTDQIYHADGQIRDEDYVYGSFIQSKMYHQGIKCSDCHDPHSTKLKFSGNQLCTSCHQHPAGKYDTPSHHRHQTGSKGSLCVECHMPSTTYMEVDGRRDHSFRIPRPDLSVRVGTPNACTSCHLDETQLPADPNRKSLGQYLDWIIARENGDEAVGQELSRIDQWMAEKCVEWYPAGQTPEKTRYYEQLATGFVEEDSGFPTLIELAGDRTAPAMIRASAVLRMAGDSSPQTLKAALKALNDEDPKIASAALSRIDMEVGRIGGRMTGQPNWSQFRPLVEAVASQLNRKSRRVRVDAARVLSAMPAEAVGRYTDVAGRRTFDLALNEYKDTLMVFSERAMSHTMLAGIHQSTNQIERAKESYRTAIFIEPNLSGPRSNLAALLGAEVERINQEAQQTLQQIGAIDPNKLREDSRYQYVQSLGKRIDDLSLQIEQLRKEEHELLRVDVQRSKGLPNTHGLHYRFGMSSYIQRDLENAERNLLEAYRQEPGIERYVVGLAAFYQEVNKPEQAAKYVAELLQIDPGNESYKLMAEQIRDRLQKE